MKYTSEQREAAISKMLSAKNKPIRDLSRELGIPATTLYHWRRQAAGEKRTEQTNGRSVPERTRREERAEATRSALFKAAAKVIGTHGYERASISRITQEAGVANGTFYNHFQTRQQLFDQLLTVVGDRLLDYIRERIGQETSGLEREKRRIRAYFDFLKEVPGFLRILTEAEVYAPKAYHAHIQRYVASYSKALTHDLRSNELAPFSEDELESLVYMLLGARTYLTMLWNSTSSLSDKKAKEALLSSYEKLVEKGVFNNSGTSQP